jgi:hypothetical protein
MNEINRRMPPEDNPDSAFMHQLHLGGLFLRNDDAMELEIGEALEGIPPEEQSRYVTASLLAYMRGASHVIAQEVGISYEDVPKYLVDLARLRSKDTPEDL